MRPILLSIPLALFASTALAQSAPAEAEAAPSYVAPVVRAVKHLKGEEFELLGDLPAGLKGHFAWAGTGELAGDTLTLSLSSMAPAKATAAADKLTVVGKIAAPSFKDHKGGYQLQVKDKDGAVIFYGCEKGKGVSCKRLEWIIAGINKLVIDRQQPKATKSMFGFYFKDIVATWNPGQALRETQEKCQTPYVMSMQVDDRDLGKIGLCEGEPGKNQTAIYMAPAKDGKPGATYSLLITDGKKLIELLEARLPKP